MPRSVDLEYEPDSLLPPASSKQVRRFEKYLRDYWARPVVLPAAYVEHVRAFHGGVPGKKCFKTPGGQVRVVGRFFNFLEPDDLEPPLVPTWRPGSEHDVRLDYSLYEYSDNERWDEKLRVAATRLLPIAGLDTAGHDCRVMAEYDLLCLSYAEEEDEEGEPAVVRFDFHESVDEAVTEFVAPSFSAFLQLLYRCKNRVVNEIIDRY